MQRASSVGIHGDVKVKFMPFKTQIYLISRADCQRRAHIVKRKYIFLLVTPFTRAVSAGEYY